MKLFKLALVGMIFVGAGKSAYAEETPFSGQALGTVDTETYETVTTYIYGDTAKAIFSTTAALARVETISDVLRRVVGQNLICFEKFPDAGSSEPINYTCKFMVNQGGKIVRPPL
jgi:hypothetical protein